MRALSRGQREESSRRLGQDADPVPHVPCLRRGQARRRMHRLPRERSRWSRRHGGARPRASRDERRGVRSLPRDARGEGQGTRRAARLHGLPFPDRGVPRRRARSSVADRRRRPTRRSGGAIRSRCARRDVLVVSCSTHRGFAREERLHHVPCRPSCGHDDRRHRLARAQSCRVHHVSRASLARRSACVVQGVPPGEARALGHPSRRPRCLRELPRPTPPERPARAGMCTVPRRRHPESSWLRIEDRPRERMHRLSCAASSVGGHRYRRAARGRVFDVPRERRQRSRVPCRREDAVHVVSHAARVRIGDEGLLGLRALSCARGPACREARGAREVRVVPYERARAGREDDMQDVSCRRSVDGSPRPYDMHQVPRTALGLARGEACRVHKLSCRQDAVGEGAPHIIARRVRLLSSTTRPEGNGLAADVRDVSLERQARRPPHGARARGQLRVVSYVARSSELRSRDVHIELSRGSQDAPTRGSGLQGLSHVQALSVTARDRSRRSRGSSWWAQRGTPRHRSRCSANGALGEAHRDKTRTFARSRRPSNAARCEHHPSLRGSRCSCRSSSWRRRKALVLLSSRGRRSGSPGHRRSAGASPRGRARHDTLHTRLAQHRRVSCARRARRSPATDCRPSHDTIRRCRDRRRGPPCRSRAETPSGRARYPLHRPRDDSSCKAPRSDRGEVTSGSRCTRAECPCRATRERISRRHDHGTCPRTVWSSGRTTRAAWQRRRARPRRDRPCEPLEARRSPASDDTRCNRALRAASVKARRGRHGHRPRCRGRSIDRGEGRADRARRGTCCMTARPRAPHGRWCRPSLPARAG